MCIKCTVKLIRLPTTATIATHKTVSSLQNKLNQSEFVPFLLAIFVGHMPHYCSCNKAISDKCPHSCFQRNAEVCYSVEFLDQSRFAELLNNSRFAVLVDYYQIASLQSVGMSAAITLYLRVRTLIYFHRLSIKITQCQESFNLTTVRI